MEQRRIVVAILIACACASANGSDNHLIGPLFLTPEQRDQLDSSGHVSPGRPERVTPGSIHFNGSIKRSSGRRTGWLNGNRLSRFEFPEHRGRLELSDDKLLVERPEGTAILKAGESLPVNIGQAQ